MEHIVRKRGKLFMENNHFVYILRCADNTLYTGYTTNIKRRIKMHESGKGAKYTRGRAPFTLVFEQSFPTKSEAMQKEHAIKQLSRSEKVMLINKNEMRNNDACTK